MEKVIIIMGSKSDKEHCDKIIETLSKLKISTQSHVASAHKTPLKVLEILRKINKTANAVIITVAGRSNALSGFVDANTHLPVLACPPYSEKFAGLDILSTIRMPSGVAPMLVLEPESVALAAAKILALTSASLKKRIIDYQNKIKENI